MRSFLPVLGTPRDFSVNAASLGALNLLTTVPADPCRAGGYAIQNQSAVDITVALDEDTTGINQTIVLLAPGAGAGQQGASAASDWGIHRGRIRVYGAVGSQVALRVW